MYPETFWNKPVPAKYRKALEFPSSTQRKNS